MIAAVIPLGAHLMGSTNEALLFLNGNLRTHEFIPIFFGDVDHAIVIGDVCDFLALEDRRDGTEPDPPHHENLKREEALSILSNWPTGGCVTVFPTSNLKTKCDACLTFLTQFDNFVDLVLIQQSAKGPWREFVELAVSLFARTTSAERLVVGWELERKCESSGNRQNLALQYRNAYPPQDPNSVVEVRSL